MNGLGDPRLTLQRHELAADGRARIVAGQRGGVPGKSRWALFWRRLTTRRALLELDDAQLQDIGLTREQAHAEALRPFWKP